MYRIYADGACQPNPGECGSGVAVYKDAKLVRLFLGNYQPMATNNIAELIALEYSIKLAIKLFERGEDRVEILSDSQYSIKCLTEWIDKPGLKAIGKEVRLKIEQLLNQCIKCLNPIKIT